jgi:hypothetical protein
VSLRRYATAAATILVAIVCALTVPVAQLRMMSRITTCCCPDPSHCHCPDHKPDQDGGPSMRTCHRESHDIVAPVLPTFTQVEVVALAPPDRAVALVSVPLRSPHAPPVPARPDAPS